MLSDIEHGGYPVASTPAQAGERTPVVPAWDGHHLRAELAERAVDFDHDVAGALPVAVLVPEERAVIGASWSRRHNLQSYVSSTAENSIVPKAPSRLRAARIRAW